jgi:hypothetical protein
MSDGQFYEAKDPYAAGKELVALRERAERAERVIDVLLNLGEVIDEETFAEMSASYLSVDTTRYFSAFEAGDWEWLGEKFENALERRSLFAPSPQPDTDKGER